MNLLRKIKYFVQRGKRGYSDEDLFSFQHLLELILAMVNCQLSRNACAYPHKYKSLENWQARLKPIQISIQAYLDCQNEAYISLDKEIELEKEIEKSLKDFNEILFHLWT